jgi:hypothetical protein
MNKVKADKVSQHWNMSYGISKLGRLVNSPRNIVPNMVQKKHNSTADCMANLGVTMLELHWLCRPRDPLLGGTKDLLDCSCEVDSITWRERIEVARLFTRGVGMSPDKG